MDSAERETIRRVLAGDADVYRVLMDRHLPAVLRMTLRVTGSMEDAEEAAQEAFLKAYNKLPGFREDASFGTWVYRIAMNCALTLVDRRSRDPGWQATPLDGTAEDLGVVRSRMPTPEAHVLEAEARTEQERLLRCLTPMERTAFVLRHLEDQPAEAIAAALGITANTARQTIFRAVGKLRRDLATARQDAGTDFAGPRTASPRTASPRTASPQTTRKTR